MSDCDWEIGASVTEADDLAEILARKLRVAAALPGNVVKLEASMSCSMARRLAARLTDPDTARLDAINRAMELNDRAALSLASAEIIEKRALDYEVSHARHLMWLVVVSSAVALVFRFLGVPL